MPKNTRPSRKMKPVILVLCEGETEECYVDFLKQKYRLPISMMKDFIDTLEEKRQVNAFLLKLNIYQQDNT